MTSMAGTRLPRPQPEPRDTITQKNDAPLRHHSPSALAPCSTAASLLSLLTAQKRRHGIGWRCYCGSVTRVGVRHLSISGQRPAQAR